jgi:hypothetical protein
VAKYRPRAKNAVVACRDPLALALIFFDFIASCWLPLATTKASATRQKFFTILAKYNRILIDAVRNWELR